MHGEHIYSLTIYAQIHKGVFPGEKLWYIAGNQGECRDGLTTKNLIGEVT